MLWIHYWEILRLPIQSSGKNGRLNVGFKNWLLSELRVPQAIHGRAESEHPWWSVMCLTGVDYFSTLGYQPGIAFLAAGVLSPLATLVLVLVTLFGALPVYWRVAKASPNGLGSIAMLEKLFPSWQGKVFILILLGFAATDFTITMTLSAADAAAHVTHNPFVPEWMKSQMGITLFLLTILGVIFLKGFREAIHIAVVFVGAYLALNAVVTTVAFWQVLRHPETFQSWRHALGTQHANPLAMLGIALILFPKLALGLSGFETGVAVMPLVRGKDVEERVRNTRKLLATSAITMSVFLVATSAVTTLLIPAEAFKGGAPANGRAVSYLAHLYLGNVFGSIYDLSTILILSFAGASAMAGLLNLIPRYLPRFGMAPEWARASRPLVLVFLTIAITVTLIFHANVDAQGGAYATGVLVLITSASLAVTMSVWRTGWRWVFFLISLTFIYTTIMNVWERPEGIKISSCFIAAILMSSLLSRAMRSTELRITGVVLNKDAEALLGNIDGKTVRIVAQSPRKQTEEELDKVDARVRFRNGLSDEEPIYFFQVDRGDASDFEVILKVRGNQIGKHRVLETKSPVVANSFAALLIELERRSGCAPHVYFRWTEGNPIVNLFYFVFLGEGDTAPLTHEVLRRAVEDQKKRPVVHVS
jgi:hypothetical protein